jgi:hypothetical protein
MLRLLLSLNSCLDVVGMHNLINFVVVVVCWLQMCPSVAAVDHFSIGSIITAAFEVTCDKAEANIRHQDVSGEPRKTERCERVTRSGGWVKQAKECAVYDRRALRAIAEL